MDADEPERPPSDRTEPPVAPRGSADPAAPRRPARSRLWGLFFALRLLRLIVVVFFALILIAVGLGAFVWVARSSALAAYLARTVTREVFQEGFVCELGDVGGSPFETIRLSGVSVRVPGGDTLLVAKKVSVRYPLSRALRGEVRLSLLEIDSLRVHLIETPGGGMVVPWKHRERARPSLVPRQNGAEAVTIGNLSVDLMTEQGKRQPLVRDLTVGGSLMSIPDGAVLAVRAKGAVPIALLELDDLAAEATLEGSTLRVTSGEARIGASRLTGTGFLSVSGPPVLHFDVALAHVETADAWKIVDLTEVFGHGWFNGTASVDRVPLAAKVTFRVAGEFNGDRVDRIEGTAFVNNETFRSADLAMDALGAHASGRLDLDLIPPRNYEADLVVTNVDLTDVPIRGELVKLHPHRINGRIRLSGDDYERTFPRMDVTAEIGPSTYLEVPFDSLHAEISLLPAGWRTVDSTQTTDRVLVRTASAWQHGGRWSATGAIVPEVFCDLDVTASGFPIEAFAPLHHSQDLFGRASFDAHVVGDLLHPDVTASGSIDSLRVGELEIGSVEVDTIDGVLVPFDAGVHARGRGIRVGSWRADSLDVTGVVADTVWVEGLAMWRSDSLFSARGFVVPEGRSARGLVTEFTAVLPLTEARLTAPASLAYEDGGYWEIGPADLALEGGSLRFSLATAERGRRPQVTVDGHDIPILDLVRIAGYEELAGAPANFHVEYVGDLVRPEFRGTAILRDLVLGEVVAEEVSLGWRGAGDSLAVTALEAHLADRGLVRASATLWGEESPVVGLFSGDPAGRLFLPSSRLRATIEGEDLALNLPGRVRTFVAPKTVTAQADTGVIIVIEKPFDPWLDLEGRARVRLDLDGRLDNPTARVALTADTVRVRRGLVIDRVEVAALLRDQLLTLSQGDLVVAGRHAQLSGFLPCAVDYSTRRARVLDRDMLVSLDVVEMPLGLVSLFVPELRILEGSVTGSGELAGSLSRPRLSGQFQVTDGEGRWFGRTEIIQEAEARIDLTDEGLVLSEFKAREGFDGRLRGTGRARSRSNYLFDFDLRDVYFTEGGLSGLVDGTLRVTPDSTTAGRLLPRVAGALTLREAEIYHWDAARPETSPEKIPALYDIDIEVGRIHVNTNELHTATNLLIGDGDLTLRNYPETIRLGGSLRVLEGSASVYGNQFRVTRGRIDFVELDGVDPELDIEAEAPLRGPYARERGYEGFDGRIIARVTGTVRKPVVELTTEPADLALSQSEILEYLTFGRYVGTGADSGLEPTADILLGLLAQDISYLFPYVDYVEIISTEETPAFHIVKNINDQLSIGYTTGVSSTPDQELSIEARLSRMFILKGGVLRGEVGSTQDVGGRYNLDLRLNIEY
jgi:hypothetical protein